MSVSEGPRIGEYCSEAVHLFCHLCIYSNRRGGVEDYYRFPTFPTSVRVCVIHMESANQPRLSNTNPICYYFMASGNLILRTNNNIRRTIEIFQISLILQIISNHKRVAPMACFRGNNMTRQFRIISFSSRVVRRRWKIPFDYSEQRPFKGGDQGTKGAQVPADNVFRIIDFGI